jgi:hypothetical protein
MQRKIDPFTTALCAMLVVGALLACKKRTPVGAIPSAASAAAEPAVTPALPAVVPPPASAATADLKLGDVKRYADKEKAQTGAARILQDGVKVFNEADDKTAEVATLDKGLLVFRLASIPDWELVEFPSGVGKVSPGWVQAKLLDVKSDAAVAREAVAAQPQAAVKTASSAAPKSSASAAASAKPATSASAKAAASSSSKPATTALTAIPINSATLNQAAQLAAQAAARAKAAADKAAAGTAGKASK